ncbi:MAG: hypothetical protein CMH60_07065 [Myxococcales bacterium]|nr:hypothetical protein [Myxococcales bacterium]|tara:strand:+ start:916 stop:1428 length:513 start_codon:yes stop_codon:yes gene_type:complete
MFFVILKGYFWGAKMLKLSEHVLAELLVAGEATYPQECCGLMAGHKDDHLWVVEKIFPLKNMVENEVVDAYQIDPQERFEKEQQIEAAGYALIGFYHSHPDHDVYFSQRDLESSEEYQFGEPWLAPVYAYFVLSVRAGEAGEYGAFIISEGRAEKIPCEVTRQRSEVHVS